MTYSLVEGCTKKDFETIEGSEEFKVRLLVTLLWFAASLLLSLLFTDIEKITVVVGGLMSFLSLIFPGKMDISSLLVMVTFTTSFTSYQYPHINIHWRHLVHEILTLRVSQFEEENIWNNVFSPLHYVRLFNSGVESNWKNLPCRSSDWSGILWQLKVFGFISRHHCPSKYLKYLKMILSKK